MFEWGATFIKLTGKLSWGACMKFAVAYNVEPTTVLGCAVVGTATLAGMYCLVPCLFNSIASNPVDTVEFEPLIIDGTVVKFTFYK